MHKRYWRYPIRKNWNYELTEVQKDRSIFCYGKPNSGKSEKVAAEVFRHAIERGRSCVIYARTPNPCYSALCALAEQKGYTFFEIDDASGCFGANELIEICRDFLEAEKAIMFVDISPHSVPFVPSNASNFVEAIASYLYHVKPSYDNLGVTGDYDKKIHVILDGVTSGFAIKLTWLCQRQLIFTVTADCHFLSKPWLQEQLNTYILNAAQNDILHTCSFYNAATNYDSKCKEIVTDFSILRNININMEEFFVHFPTIVCTGADYVAPDTHKSVLSEFLFSRNKGINVGGKFIISELENRFDAAVASNKIWSASSSRGIGANGGVAYRQIDGDSIERNHYALMSYVFWPGTWAIEVDGRILMYFAGEMYGPVLHMDHEDAMDWLNDYALTQGVKLTPAKEKPHTYCYKWYDHDGLQHEMVFTLTEVTEENVQRLRDNFLISILEIEDAESRLDRHEAFYSDKLPSGIFWDRKLLPYFPESIEYFQLFTHISKIEEQERVAAELERQRQAKMPFEVPEEYRWKPYVAIESVGDQRNDEPGNEEITLLGSKILPKDKVLFMGGHQNLIKKLRQIFPEWSFVTDDLWKEGGARKVDTIFFWTKHASHKMQWYVEKRMSDDMNFLYVKSTNLRLLLREMEEAYLNAQCTDNTNP